MMLPKAGCDPRIRQQILEDIEKLDDYQRIESKYNQGDPSRVSWLQGLTVGSTYLNTHTNGDHDLYFSF